MNFFANWLFKSRIIPGILSGLICFSCSAQDLSIQYQLFTVNEGLPQNYLLGLAQDSSGFIWIGTKDGLAKYDGYRFTIFRRGKDSLHTPASNNVTNLYTDYRGYLWIQYDNRAFDRYDPSTGIFDHISNLKIWDTIRSQLVPYELLIDRHDNLWVLTENKGFYRYDLRSGKLSSFTHLSGVIDDTARAIMEDHSGKIWMVTQKGFSVYDYTRDHLKNIPFQLSARQTYSGRNHNLGIGELENGKLIVTSLDSVGLIYDPVNNSFQTIRHKIKNDLVFDAGLGNTNMITSHNGDRWFICNGRILKIDKKTDEITEVADPSRPAKPDASVLMIDRSGTLWFGKNAQGLCKINLATARFVSRKYSYGNFETDILINELGLRETDLPDKFNSSAYGYNFRNTLDTINKVIWIQNYFMSRYSSKLMAYDITSKKIITKNILNSKDGEVGLSVDRSGNTWFIRINDWDLVKINRDKQVGEQLIDIPLLSSDSLFKAGKVAINPVVDKDIMWVMASNASIDFGTWMLVSINLQSKNVRYYQL
jgi:ligand-binding sensor domain-containing protein